jgi:[acyl-carrier-protein] S-malonyltransferase
MIVFTFPGQGSQKPGMGRAWVGHPSWEVVAEASAALGRDLAHLVLDADAEELRATRNAQLATLVTSLVVLDAVERLGVEPAAVAGHSLGEYSALVASGALSFEDAVRLVDERGEAMRLASTEHEGTMAAVIGLGDDDVVAACAEVDEEVWVANFNAPGQVVVAGSPAGVAAAGERAKERGAKKVLPVAVSGAFHTPYMRPALDRLRKAIDAAELRAPELAVYANVDARPHAGADEWVELLATQLTSPVQWRQTLHHLDEGGFTTFVELGPGTILTGTAKRTVDGARTLSVGSPDDLDRLLASLAEQPAALGGGVHEGEHLFATERVVVSPSAGVFTLAEGIGPGTRLEPGNVVGRVGQDEVRSPFAGEIMGVLAVEGERVTISQPVAWLRTS